MLRTRRLPLFLLAIAGFVLLLAGVTLQLAQRRATAVTTGAGADISSLPRQLAGQDMTASETGQAALAEIETMHGKGFAPIGGQAAHYGDATLWVASTQDANGAREMTDSMTARIAEGRSPFQPTGFRQVNGHTVYTLTGMDQSHFYWQAGDQVAWLAIAADKSEQGLREALVALDQR